MSGNAEPGRTRRAIVVRLGGERHAVPADAVEEVVDRPALTALPRLDRHVPGLLRFRDAWVPAVDPMPLIGARGRTTAGVALVVRRGAARVALLADDVDGIVDLDDARLAGAAGQGAAETVGAFVDAEGPVGLLLPDTLFRATLSGEEETAMRESPAESTAVVAFRIGDTELGVPVGQVVEVAPVQEVREAGRGGEPLAGALLRRGEPVPVLDLRPRFHTGPAADASVVLVLAAGGRVFGLLADRVSDVVHVGPGDVAPLPAYLAGAAAAFVTGLARRGQRLLVLVDAAAFLSPGEWGRIEALDLHAKVPDAGEDAAGAR